MSVNITTSTPTNPQPPATPPTALRFLLGMLVATPGALDALSEAGQEAADFITRHANLEQGELSDDDHQENLFSVD